MASRSVDRMIKTVMAASASAVLVVAIAPPAVANAQVKVSTHPSGLQVYFGEYREFGRVPDDLRPLLGAAEQLAGRLPSDFARPWVDKVRNVVVIDVATDRGTSLAADIQNMRQDIVSVAPELAPAEGPLEGKAIDLRPLAAAMSEGKVVQRPVRNSATRIQAIEDALIELSRRPEYEAENIWMVRADPPNNRVIVTADHLSDGMAEEIVKLFGRADVAVEVQKDLAPPQPESGNRWADNSPFYGGARIRTGVTMTPTGECTDAFSWYSGSQNMMLTAGHCIANGGYVHTMTQYMGTVTVSSRENWSDSVGTVYLTGQSTYRGDMALVSVVNGSSTGRIYRGNSNSSTSAPVGGMAPSSSQPGDPYCTGGSSRLGDGSAGPGEVCGWTVGNVHVSYEYAPGHWYRNVVRSTPKTGWCTRPGDSGAPVYVVSGSTVYAKGIHNAGSGGGDDHYGGIFDPCIEVFTDIWQAYEGFPGVIRTG